MPTEAQITTPAPVQLMPHQLDITEKALKILERGQLCLVAGAPRIGKTLAALEIGKRRTARAILVVTKKAAIPDWNTAVTTMGMTGSTTVINYEALPKLPPGRFELVIVDESHRVGAFPKPCLAYPLLKERCEMAKVLLLSGTPAIESGAKLYHQTQLARMWTEHNFYKWHAVYGIKRETMRYGKKVMEYNEVNMHKIIEIVGPIIVSCTQDDARIAHQAVIYQHLIDMDPQMKGMYDDFNKNAILKVGPFTIVGATAPQQAMYLHMMTGGEANSDRGATVRLNDTKARYVKNRFGHLRKVAIFTEYLSERKLISEILGVEKCTTEMDYFEKGPWQYFIASNKKHCEGVNLAYCDEMIIYSLPWSGSTYVQQISRLTNMMRDRPIRINVLLMRGTVDEMIFKTIELKQDFNARLYQ